MPLSQMSYGSLTLILWGARDTTPRLAFMSPEKESGKSKALQTSSLYVSDPELFPNASPAALVRVVAQGRTRRKHPDDPAR